MQILHFKLVTYIIGALLLFNATVLKAQFIRFKLEIPPSFIMNERVLQADVLNMQMGATEIDDQKVKGVNYRWIEIRTNENLGLIIDARKLQNKSAVNSSVMYLNDGSNNFLLARSFDAKIIEMKMLEATAAKTLTTTLFSAWLGLPEDVAGILTVIYP